MRRREGWKRSGQDRQGIETEMSGQGQTMTLGGRCEAGVAIGELGSCREAGDEKDR